MDAASQSIAGNDLLLFDIKNVVDHVHYVADHVLNVVNHVFDLFNHVV